MDIHTVGIIIAAVGALLAIAAKMLQKFTGLISKLLIGIGVIGGAGAYFMGQMDIAKGALISLVAGLAIKFVAGGSLFTLRIIGLLMAILGIALYFFNIF